MRPTVSEQCEELYECDSCGKRAADADRRICDSCGGELIHLGKSRDL